MLALTQDVVTVLITTDQIDLLARIWRETLYLSTAGAQIRYLIETSAVALAKNCGVPDCKTFKDLMDYYDTFQVCELIYKNPLDLLYYLKSVRGERIPLLVLSYIPQQITNDLLSEVLLECLSRDTNRITKKWQEIQYLMNLHDFQFPAHLLTRKEGRNIVVRLLLSECKLSTKILKQCPEEAIILIMERFFHSDYKKDGIFMQNYPHIWDYLQSASVAVIKAVLELEEKEELIPLYRDMANFILDYTGPIADLLELPENKYFKEAMKTLILGGNGIRRRKPLLKLLYGIN